MLGNNLWQAQDALLDDLQENLLACQSLTYSIKVFLHAMIEFGSGMPVAYELQDLPAMQQATCPTQQTNRTSCASAPW